MSAGCPAAGTTTSKHYSLLKKWDQGENRVPLRCSTGWGTTKRLMEQQKALRTAVSGTSECRILMFAHTNIEMTISEAVLYIASKCEKGGHMFI